MAFIYLDHNATTPVQPEVAQAMAEVLGGGGLDWNHGAGNPSSLHAAGREARRRVEDARESLARLLGADPKEIIFTGGGTEANNLALLGFAAAAREPLHIVSTSFEHSSVLEPLRALEARGWRVTRVDPDGSGVVRPVAVEAALTPETALVSVMAANNEVGTVQPAADIGALCKARGIAFHCDAIQALGKLAAVRPAEWGADYVSLSAHKINGPKGIGALWVRKGAALKGLLHGGPHERGLRGGTENVPGIVGFGKAADVWLREGESERARLAGLRDALEAALKARLPGLRVNGADAERLPNTLHVTLPGCPSDLMVMGLDMRDLAVSSGSACASGASRHSYVLLAMGKGKEAAGSSLRLSLGLGNTEADIPHIVDRIAETAASVGPAA